MSNEVTIRVGGESGEGVNVIGELLGLAAARAGYYVHTFRTVPAEILGGPVMSQIRIGEQPVLSMGDYADVLVCFNQEAYDRHFKGLRPGGVLLYDPGEVHPEPGNYIPYAIPINELVRKEVGIVQAKNTVVLGILSALFGPAYEAIEEVIQSRLSKTRKSSEELMAKNMLGLQVGYNYPGANLTKSDPYKLSPVEKQKRYVLTGNQAIIAGALAANCRFFAGYPITPASDIMEGLAKELPLLGGSFLQAEDEIAAITAVIGASFGGVRSMTATSGPGLSLMSEALGFASMAEVPVVIVDAQRAGPSTGMPTKMEQSDLALALYMSHGDVPRMVIAPGDVAECYQTMIEAFNMSERYQMPCIVLTDQGMTGRVEAIEPEKFFKPVVETRMLANATAGELFERYAITESGISPTSIPGKGAPTYRGTGLEHDELGHPNYEEKDHTEMTFKRFRKLETAKKEMDSTYIHGDENAKVGVIGWGSTKGAIQEAVDRAREKGHKVSMLHPRILSPLPDKEIIDYTRSVDRVIVPEGNYSGQLANLLGAKYGLEPIRVNKFGGIPFTAGEILRAIEEVK